MINKIDAVRINYLVSKNQYSSTDASKNNSNTQLSFKSASITKSPLARKFLFGTGLAGLISVFSGGLGFPELAKDTAWLCGGLAILTVITDFCYRIFGKKTSGSGSYCGFGPDANG